MDITIEYIILHITLIVVMYYVGKDLDLINKTSYDKKYWFKSRWAIVAFTIEEGFRWGRFGDWIHYYFQYNFNNLESYEFLFRYTWQLYYSLGIPFCIVMSISALIFICSILFFIKPYQGLLKYILPMVVLYTTLGFEQFIRWYIALSFVLVSFRLFLDKKYIYTLLFVLLGFFHHYGIIVFVPMFLILYYVHVRVNPMIIIGASVFLIFLFSSQWLLYLSRPINSLFSYFEVFNGYQQDIEGWLTGTGQNANLERKSSIVYLISMIPLYVILITNYSLIKNNIDRGTHFLYINYLLSSLGILLISFSSGLEFLGRYCELFYVFISISFALGWNYYMNKKDVACRIPFLFLLSLFFVYKFYLFVRPLLHEDMMTYWWNYTLNPWTLIKYY